MAGPARDKRRYFIRHLENRLDAREYPHLTFGDGPDKTVQYFLDKLPIGVLSELDHHAFVYLVTSPSPMDFRLFLLRHVPSSACSSDGRFGCCFHDPFGRRGWSTSTPRASTWATVSSPRTFRFSVALP